MLRSWPSEAGTGLHRRGLAATKTPSSPPGGTFDVMVAELREAAGRYAGLHLRLNECKWAEMRRRGQETREAVVPPEEPLKVPGAYAHPHGVVRHESEHNMATVWRAFYANIHNCGGRQEASTRNFASITFACSRQWPGPVAHAVGRPPTCERCGRCRCKPAGGHMRQKSGQALCVAAPSGHATHENMPASQVGTQRWRRVGGDGWNRSHASRREPRNEGVAAHCDGATLGGTIRCE